MKKKQSNLKNKPKGPNPMRYAGLGIQMVSIIGIFVFAGYKLDEWQQTDKKLYTLFASLFGVVISMTYMIRELIRKP